MSAIELTEARVRELRLFFREYFSGYEHKPDDDDSQVQRYMAVVALCDAWLARGVTEAEREACRQGALVLDNAADMIAPPAGSQPEVQAELRHHAATLRALASRKPREGDFLPLNGATSNEHCLRLVQAVRKGMSVYPHGDFIDQGLALVRILAEAGYRISPADVPSAETLLCVTAGCKRPVDSRSTYLCTECAGRVADVPSAGVCGTCNEFGVVPDRDTEDDVKPCPDCTGRVAASDAKETT